VAVAGVGEESRNRKKTVVLGQIYNTRRNSGGGALASERDETRELQQRRAIEKTT